ncbi:hypothetical protein IFM89_039489 [Coptis chinensis]|uniref:GLTSCR protein conserved domain-containing protein n=1 Tax=Coptis chinensis TaxID=261450 RepID=A0A835J454_9MAGN|nr:hypothetical protein IFM89_039489 [Coptis chinensis]
MDESNTVAHQHQQQQLLLQQQHQQQQQFLLLQQYQQQQQQQQQAISRFPSNIDAHLRPLGSLQHRQQSQQQQSPTPNSNSNSNLQQKANRGQGNPVELEMAYQDAWRVCHPDIKRPFSSLEDACERLLPYHVVADYEAEEDDRILDSDTTGQMPSRSQQWDHNIAAKVAEFTATFEKQVLAFNIISRKRAMGEFRAEERLMVEQALLQEEKHMLLDIRAEMESMEKANRDAAEAKMRMAAIVQAEQARAEAQTRAEMLARAPMRGNAAASQADGGSIDHHLGGQEHGVNMDEMMHGWGNTNREEEEPSEDFLNDENEPDNEESDMQDEWRETGEFDLNTR